jgi:hypothetical protein
MSIQEANHALFQCANACLFLSYLATDLLFLRFSLALASAFFVAWAIDVLDVSLDTALWNSVFLVLNVYKGAMIMYNRRPIVFDDEALEKLYENLFLPLGVSRLDFKGLAAEALVRRLRQGTIYLEAGNEAHQLSLIRSGEMLVLDPGSRGTTETVLNTIRPMEFVESPQWAALHDSASQSYSSLPGKRCRSTAGVEEGSEEPRRLTVSPF